MFFPFSKKNGNFILPQPNESTNIVDQDFDMDKGNFL